MFIEPQLHTKKRGWIEVICGSMFSGKTEELIRRLKRAEYAGLNVEIFKPLVDTRYSEKQVVSHNKNAINSTPISSSSELYMLTENIDVVGIDEAQFFDEEIVVVLEKLAVRGVRIIVAGLDMDYLGQPFGPMPQLLAVAEYVTKLHAICMDCGTLASRSHRIVYDSDEQVLLGEKDAYEPLCRTCYNRKTKSESQNTSSD